MTRQLQIDIVEGNNSDRKYVLIHDSVDDYSRIDVSF